MSAAIRHILLVAIAIIVGAVAPASAQEASAGNEAVAIVVHSGTRIDDVSLTQLRRIFLAEQQFWSDRSRITLLVRAPAPTSANSYLSAFTR